MKDLARVAMVIIAILTANFLQSVGLLYMSDHMRGTSVYKRVALSMAAAVLIFYPVFRLLEKYIKAGSARYVKGSARLTGNKFAGLLIGFTVAVLLLFIGFSYTWYQRNAFMDFKNWLKGLL